MTTGKVFKKNASMVIVAQAIILLTSVLKSLLIPQILGVDDFAYWQIYVLYSGFVGVFSLGFNDGIYLLYGDKDYEDLPFAKMRVMTRLNALMLGLFAVTVCILALLMDDPLRSSAVFFVGLDILAVCVSGLFLYVLQITNRFKEYSLFATVDKIAMLVAIACIALAGVIDPRAFMVADCATKFLVCGMLVWRCRDLLIGKAEGLSEGVREYLATIKVGISLLFANLAGMLAVNLGRFIVELAGDLSAYAYYSFGISLTNLVLTFVTAVSLTVYPSLKRLPESNLPKYFKKINNAVSIISLVSLACYCPVFIFVHTAFPQYQPMLAYLGMLFLSVIGQVKMQLLCNTYYKALRMERRLFVVNLEGIAIMLVTGGISYALLGDVRCVAAATAFTMLVRSWLSEWELARALNVWNSRRVRLEILVCGLFITAAMFPGYVGPVASFIVCVLCVLLMAVKMKITKKVFK